MPTFLKWFFVFIPLAIMAELLHWPAVIIFILSCLAIVPLAKLMGTATEEIAHQVGPGLGGLLNATFGNAVELIIAVMALRAGLIDVVKASITGSIIGNLLLVLGLSLFLGGLKFPEQRFNRTVAGVNSALLILAVISLILPAAFAYTDPKGTALIVPVSLAISLLLLAGYAAGLLFALRTHKHHYGTSDAHTDEGNLGWSKKKSMVVLALATVLVGVMSEFLVGSLEEATHAMHLTPLFVGVILVPIIGNAAEHLAAVTVARKNKMDLSLGIAIGSSIQIALFVAPVLVLVGWLMGQPMDLFFKPFELVAVVAAILITHVVTLDGESNWLEGFQLLMAYAIMGAAFFFHS